MEGTDARLVLQVVVIVFVSFGFVSQISYVTFQNEYLYRKMYTTLVLTVLKRKETLSMRCASF
jgi:hypothetical protein